MKGHNVCFNGKILKIIPKLSLLPLLIWSTVLSFYGTSNVQVYVHADVYKEYHVSSSLLYKGKLTKH